LTANRVDEVIDQAGLTAVARRKAGGFSLGMWQRLGIAAAMLGDPPVLMLDEPFNGMDPEGIAWMRGFLLAAASGDRVRLRTTAEAEAAAVLERATATATATLAVSGLNAEKIVILLSGQAVPFSEVSAPGRSRSASACPVSAELASTGHASSRHAGWRSRNPPGAAHAESAIRREGAPPFMSRFVNAPAIGQLPVSSWRVSGFSWCAGQRAILAAWHARAAWPGLHRCRTLSRSC
jgi:hypothetical protein